MANERLLPLTFELVPNLGQAIPNGTVATYRFVDANSGVIELQYQITMNGSSTVTVDGPNDVPDGGHYLTFDFLDNGYFSAVLLTLALPCCILFHVIFIVRYCNNVLLFYY